MALKTGNPEGAAWEKDENQPTRNGRVQRDTLGESWNSLTKREGFC